MRITSSIVVATCLLATALTFAGPLPAEAGRACNRLGLGSPCIKSNDLKARLDLDEDGRDARLRLRNGIGDNALELDASSGNVTNLFSKEQNASNGLVKAWARIDRDGTVDACWRCNTDPNQTRLVETGVYRIDFTPLATDIRGRPLSATVTDAAVQAVIRAENDPFDLSAVDVIMTAPSNDAPVDRSFALIIY